MNAILEILQLCTNELSHDGQNFESIWTLDGQQVTNLNDLDPECKICLVSTLPMMDMNASSPSLRARRKPQRPTILELGMLDGG